MNQPLINTKALFTDQTETFLKVMPIRPPSRRGRKRYAIRIRLRTAAGEVDRCVLLTDSGEIPMQVEREDKWFIFFVVEVETGWDPLRYAFWLRLADSGREVIYKRTGVEWAPGGADAARTAVGATDSAKGGTEETAVAARATDSAKGGTEETAAAARVTDSANDSTKETTAAAQASGSAKSVQSTSSALARASAVKAGWVQPSAADQMADNVESATNEDADQASESAKIASAALARASAVKAGWVQSIPADETAGRTEEDAVAAAAAAAVKAAGSEEGASAASAGDGKNGTRSGARAGTPDSKADSKTDGWWYFAPEFNPPEWAKGAVMYQIFTDRFCNGDPGNDVVTGEYFYNGGLVFHVDDWYSPPACDDTREHYGGDLQGIIDKLDYLDDLGIDAIYLNPIFVSPSNHKYDTQDYSHIDPHFGKIVHDAPAVLPWGATDNAGAGKYKARVTDPANLEASDRLFAHLVREAHRRGIRVILDGVFNHCGSFHRWLDREKLYLGTGSYAPGAYNRKDSPFRHYFAFQEDAWPDNDTYESWWGFETLPKLNYEASEELCEEILRVAAKWVSPPYNADGWRLDVAADLGHSETFNHRFWQRFRHAVKRANPSAIILAENYLDSADWLRGSEWDTIMNYEGFMEPLTWFLTGMEKHGDDFRKERLGDPERFWQAMKWEGQNDMPQVPLMCSMNQLSNHDHSRFLTRTARRVGRLSDLGTEAASDGVRVSVYREAAVVQMTWPGAPTIYYGDEAGLCGFTDPDNRRTYPWGREDKEMIRFHRELIRMHKEIGCLKDGSVVRLTDDRNMLCYGRFDGNSSAVVVLNNREEPMTVRIPVVYAGVPDDAHMKLRFLTGQNGFLAYPRTVYKAVDGILTIEMGPESAAVLVR